MFIDKVQIVVNAGHGGNGCASFRRERFVPKGGPDGGDGGRGGDVIISSNPNQQSLSSLKNRTHYAATSGGSGSGKGKHGRNGQEVVITVPCGTLIKDIKQNFKILADLDDTDSQVVVAKGGKGGRGNARFVSSTNQFPRQCESGLQGESRKLELELKIIADIGLVGYPNAGKSTFLSVVSKAKPKIADYPFTTLKPNVGIIEFEDFFRMTVADIPGLIDGAHKNVGLGHEFLKHIERTKVLVYLLDVGSEKPQPAWKDFECLRTELEFYNPNLTLKKSIILANKMDLKIAERTVRRLRDVTDLEIHPPISCTQFSNIDESIKRLREILGELN